MAAEEGKGLPLKYIKLQVSCHTPAEALCPRREPAELLAACVTAALRPVWNAMSCPRCVHTWQPLKDKSRKLTHLISSASGLKVQSVVVCSTIHWIQHRYNYFFSISILPHLHPGNGPWDELDRVSCRHAIATLPPHKNAVHLGPISAHHTRSFNMQKPEVRFARRLASNDPGTRSRAVKSLKRWMASRSVLPNGERVFSLFGASV